MCRSSVQNACEPASEGGMQSDMVYRPAMGFLAHSIVHSVFSLARGCRWSFAMVVGSVAGSSSIASLPIRLPYRSLPYPCVPGHTRPLYSPFGSRRGTTSPLPRNLIWRYHTCDMVIFGRLCRPVRGKIVTHSEGRWNQLHSSIAQLPVRE